MNPARCAVVFMLAVTLAAAEARAQTPGSSQDSSRRIYLRGCSFLPPQGEGWALRTPGGQGSGRLIFSRLVSKDPKTLHETNMGVITWGSRGVRDRDELLAFQRSEMQGPDFPQKGDRLLGWEATPDSLQGLACVRFRYRVAVPPDGQWANVQSVYGVMLVHPDAPGLVVTLYGTDSKYFRKKDAVAAAVAEPGPPPDPAGEAFFRNLRLVGRDGRCQYSDTLGYGGPHGVAIGHGSVWVAQFDTGEVLRIDPAQGQVVARVFAGHSPVGLAITEDAVWVANSADATVLRIDPRTNQVAATVNVGKRPLQLAVGGGAVWVTNAGNGTVSRIDPVTNQTQGKPIKVGREPNGILYHEGVLWVTDKDRDVVLRIDPQTGATFGKPISVGSGPNDLAIGAGSLWVNCQNGAAAVWRVDPSSGAALATIPSTRFPSTIAFGRDKLWICDYDDGTVSRIDPATNTFVGEPIRAGISLLFIRAADDGLWVTDQAGATVIRVPYE